MAEHEKRRVIVLWADDSPSSVELERDLAKQGFQVDRYYSESPKPVVKAGKVSFVGYKEIYWSFLVPTAI